MIWRSLEVNMSKSLWTGLVSLVEFGRNRNKRIPEKIVISPSTNKQSMIEILQSKFKNYSLMKSHLQPDIPLMPCICKTPAAMREPVPVAT
jgi:hypothetical protein